MEVFDQLTLQKDIFDIRSINLEVLFSDLLRYMTKFYYKENGCLDIETVNIKVYCKFLRDLKK